MKYRVLLTTGGTGGHVYPAIAVAEQLYDKAEVLFVGSQYGPESQMVQQANIPFCGLPVKGILGRKWKALTALLKMGQAVFMAKRLLQDFRPHIVVGFGSYASFAPLLAAKIKRIPIAIHEQNAIPGLTNRLLGRLASKIFLSMPDKLQVFAKNKAVYTGNPVRKSIIELQQDIESKESTTTKRLLVMGGSLGAKTINSIVLSGLKRLHENGIEVQHQTGANDWERVQSGYKEYEKNSFQVMPFIENMAESYRWADLVLCRAGASSIAELAVTRKPSILIPFPHATHDHQTYNAQYLVDTGSAILIHEKDVATMDLIGVIIELFNNKKALNEMMLAAYKYKYPNAAVAVAKEILNLLSTGR